MLQYPVGFDENTSGLICEIYRCSYDCTNGGWTAIQRGYKDVLLVGEGIRGPFPIKESLKDRPIMMLCYRKWRGENGKQIEYYHVEPLFPAEKRPWFMMGGNFIHTSDSRFAAINRYPLPVHDRQE